MKQIVFLILVMAYLGCQKETAPEPVRLPDLTQYWINTHAARMYSAPAKTALTDTSIYFQNHVYYTISGTYNAVCWSYLGYEATETTLTFTHRQGPLKGVEENLVAVEAQNGFVRLKSAYRSFWLKNE